MKKIILALFFTTLLHAQDQEAPIEKVVKSDERTMLISIEPIQIVNGAFNATYFYKLSNYALLTVPASFGTNVLLRTITSSMSAITDYKYSSNLLFGTLGVGTRFFFDNQGLSSGLFLEPRVSFSYSNYDIKKNDTALLASKRFTISPSLHLGYAWFFRNGLYLSTGVEAGAGYHAKNDINIDKNFQDRLKDKWMIRNALWADEGKWRFDYGYSLSVGFSW